MGTSLSGLTPATTFDGLLKVGDNDPLNEDLKAVSTGDGTDTILQLSTTALQIGGATTINGAQMTIVGASNDFNTNALLIKNSDNNDLLKIVNRGDYVLGHPGMSGAGTINASANGISFNIGNANRSEFRSTYQWWNTNGGFGITAAPSARLHIKGEAPSGDPLNNPTALLVQNSAGTDLFKVDDNSFATLSGSLRINRDNTQNAILLGNAAGSTKASIHRGENGGLHLQGGPTYYKNDIKVGFGQDDITFSTDSSQRMVINPTGEVGIGESTPTARLHIKGEAPSGDPLNNPTALLVQNSAGMELMKVTDDGIMDVRQAIFVNHSSFSSRQLRIGWGSIYATDNAAELQIGAVYSQAATAPKITLGGKTRLSGADAIQVQTLNGMYIATTANSEDPSAKLHIKGSAPVEDPPGSGTFTNPTALLVQNSAGTDLLKVADNGVLTTKQINTSNGNILAGAGIYYGRNFQATNIFQYGINSVYSATASPTTLGASGDKYIFSATLPYAPTGGSENLSIINASPTINQTGGANGITRGLYVNPTLTSATDFRSIETTGGKVILKSSGNDNTTTALLLQNSDGTELLKVEDGSAIGVNGFTIESNIIKPRVNGFIGIKHSDNRTFSIIDFGGTRTYLNVQSSSTSNFADVSVNTDHLVVKKEGNVAVGTSTLDASAKLQVDSTTQGFLPPRMTQGERDLIATPAAGLMIYNTDANVAECWNGSAWMRMF